MPTIASSDFPTPKNWQDFELITLAALKIRWNTMVLFANGRTGQPQAGVDISGTIEGNRLVAVQCKKRFRTKLTENVMKSELRKLERFKPRMPDEFYFAVTHESDAILLQKAREISEARKSENKCPVYLLFWSDIIDDLGKDATAIRYYFPQFFYSSFHTDSGDGCAASSDLTNAYLDAIVCNTRHTQSELELLVGSSIERCFPVLRWCQLYRSNIPEAIKTLSMRLIGHAFNRLVILGYSAIDTNVYVLRSELAAICSFKSYVDTEWTPVELCDSFLQDVDVSNGDYAGCLRHSGASISEYYDRLYARHAGLPEIDMVDIYSTSGSWLDVNRLTRLTFSHEIGVRVAAINALANTRFIRAWNVVFSKLNDPSEVVRATALFGLEDIARENFNQLKACFINHISEQKFEWNHEISESENNIIMFNWLLPAGVRDYCGQLLRLCRVRLRAGAAWGKGSALAAILLGIGGNVDDFRILFAAWRAAITADAMGVLDTGFDGILDCVRYGMNILDERMFGEGAYNQTAINAWGHGRWWKY